MKTQASILMGKVSILMDKMQIDTRRQQIINTAHTTINQMLCNGNLTKDPLSGLLREFLENLEHQMLTDEAILSGEWTDSKVQRVTRAILEIEERQLTIMEAILEYQTELNGFNLHRYLLGLRPEEGDR